jgi:bidirectional [NiFe] hydrogenase diaphorase subunit
MAQADQVAGAKPVPLTINGQKVEASAGMTVLEAAKAAGIDIPTMCYHAKLSGYGACRLCVVEIVKGKRSRIVVSCLYPVEEGLEVQTESERVVRHRKMILELMLARWPRVDMKLLQKYGVEKSRFDENTTFCILCGLCVRYCAEVKKQNVLGFIGRGTQRQVVIYPELATKACPECDGGKMGCVQVCPTGVIPNDFAVSSILSSILEQKEPLAFPVRMRDDDNARRVDEHVGNVERKKKR